MKVGTTYFPPVIIDNGSKFCKVGFAGEENPKTAFPSVTGRPKPTGIICGYPIKEYYVGNEVLKIENRSNITLRYPIENGMITDWDEMERIWFNCYYNELRIPPEEQPCLLTEAPLTPKFSREKMIQIMFETFTVPNVYVGNQAVLSLYASGRTTGLVIESGHDISHAVPVYEGYALYNAIEKIYFAGRDITEYFVKLLGEAGIDLRSDSHKELSRDMKEKTCFVALDFEQAQKEAEQIPKDGIIYKLPDGKTIAIGSQSFRAPEILFNPIMVGEELPGIHKLAYKAILKCDTDLRRDLYANVCLGGGTTTLEGFPERLNKELYSLAPPAMKVKIVAPDERKYSAWVGGSIFAASSTFGSMSISIAEYDEIGPTIIHRNCF